MKAMLFLTLATIGISAQALVAPGAIVNHELNCTVPKAADGAMLLGAGYSVQCFTQALAPQYSVRGCNLETQVVSPKAQPTQTSLTQVSQDANEAVFQATGVQVTLNKKTFKATLELGNGAKATCVEVEPK